MWKFVVCVIAMFSASVTAVEAEAQSNDEIRQSSPLSFLKGGADYVIRFPEGYNVFRTTRSEVTQSTYTTEEGKTKSGGPATWTITLTVEIFRVVRFGGGSWVLLEHPAKTDDIAKWNGQRRALAQLADKERIAALESSEEGRERLARIREAAQREIETSQTWINLNHAIAITEVPTEDARLELTVKSVETKSK